MRVEHLNNEDYEKLLNQTRDRAERLLHEVRDGQVTVESTDRLIRVTAGALGQLSSIQIAPAALRQLDAERLSAAVLATVQEALGKASRSVTDIVGVSITR